ncbi:hypothetical protein [Vibrio aquimaris]|uniref:Uncharacterized protein n=1 Tax=Vibrio aquimaris TaxID=2587862 RepID=A0A5P9CIB1_9VIBR|nr:hypothetical protein [Vibrio aquimaris]QFT25946.1 hypothetical protein FIV01_05860 [Vibrio aquimaris]
MSDESLEPSSTNPIKSLTSLATPLVFAESGLTSIDANRIKSHGKSFWHSLQDTFEDSAGLLKQEVSQQYHDIHDQVEAEFQEVKHTIESVPEEISKQLGSAVTDMKEKMSDYQIDKRIESSFDSLKNAFDVFKW